MKKGLSTTATSILALSLASPSFGKASYPGFERDMALAFENDGEPMELALLSDQEMRETKGAVFSIWAQYFFGGVAGATVYIMENLGSGRFYADEFGAYMILGALTGGGHGVGYTRGGRMVLTGMAAAIVTRFHRQSNDQ